MTQSTNATVAKFATERGALELQKRTLIGIVGTAENKRVLVRFMGGRIDTLTVGDRLTPGKITAISDDTVMIGTATGSHKLTMPKRSAA